jgi:hypothetical protein
MARSQIETCYYSHIYIVVLIFVLINQYITVYSVRPHPVRTHMRMWTVMDLARLGSLLVSLLVVAISGFSLTNSSQTLGKQYIHQLTHIDTCSLPCMLWLATHTSRVHHSYGKPFEESFQNNLTNHKFALHIHVNQFVHPWTNISEQSDHYPVF